MSTIDKSDFELRRDWGITPGYWLWSSRMRILFVIDGAINLGFEGGAFGLGQVLQTLRTPFSWWASFSVDVAKRDGPKEPVSPDLEGVAYCNFRFTDAGFDINAYDQIWFFGHKPFDDFDIDSDIPKYSPLDSVELKMLAEWMDRGGGVFATGDHGLLGASMCSNIPRVRTMRKWKHQQDVPFRTGSTRHSTLQPTPESEDREEEDVLLQPVELVFRPFVHPLFCSHRGLITRFPDHMHEGEVIDDDFVALDQLLDLHLDLTSSGTVVTGTAITRLRRVEAAGDCSNVLGEVATWSVIDGSVGSGTISFALGNTGIFRFSGTLTATRMTGAVVLREFTPFAQAGSFVVTRQ